MFNLADFTKRAFNSSFLGKRHVCSCIDPTISFSPPVQSSVCSRDYACDFTVASAEFWPLLWLRYWLVMTVSASFIQWSKFFESGNYVETMRLTIHANCRLRRVFFMDRLYHMEELNWVRRYARYTVYSGFRMILCICWLQHIAALTNIVVRCFPGPVRSVGRVLMQLALLKTRKKKGAVAASLVLQRRDKRTQRMAWGDTWDW